MFIQPLPERCPNPWTLLSHGCYTFISEPTMDWAGAKQTCEDLQGHLVKIESKEENLELYEEITRLQMPGSWIGLNDIQEEGNWVWTGGETPAFTDWFPGQPGTDGAGHDTAEREDCAGYHPTSAEQWHDYI